MNHIYSCRKRHLQRGAAALITSVMLLLVTGVVMLYLNRSLIFEQKTSANQLRSTSALETAEAGLEWAIGMLNYTNDIDANCQAVASPTSSTYSFRKKYVQTYWGRTPTAGEQANFDAYYEDSTSVVPVRRTFPGCKINGSTLSCTCPLVDPSTLTMGAGGVVSDAASAPAGGAVLPTFTVAFAPVTAAYPPAATPNLTDPTAVMVTVTGCTATSGNCAPGTVSGGTGPDAVTTVSAIVKLRPLLRSGPAAALTCGRNCAPGGSNQIINTDPSTNGVTINAGGTITVSGGANTYTIPGLPPQNAQVSGDSSLSSLANADDTNCSNGNVFSAYFGSSLADYKKAATIIDCSSATDCGAKLVTAYAQNKRSFFFPSGLTLNNSSGFPGGALGSSTDPVTLVTDQSIRINGNISIYGMLFSNDANTSELGMGTSNLYGSVVTCRDQNSNGNGTIAYDPNVIRGTQRGDTAEAVRIPGSWTDACKLSSASPPVRSCN